MQINTTLAIPRSLRFMVKIFNRKSLIRVCLLHSETVPVSTRPNFLREQQVDTRTDAVTTDDLSSIDSEFLPAEEDTPH